MPDGLGLKLKYFILCPGKLNEYGQASRCAILRYAHSIDYHDPQLAKDLIWWVEHTGLRGRDEDDDN